jgi:hypothetical protein
VTTARKSPRGRDGSFAKTDVSPPRFLSALDKDWYADVELCELPAGQRVLVPALQAMLPNRTCKPS